MLESLTVFETSKEKLARLREQLSPLCRERANLQRQIAKHEFQIRQLAHSIENAEKRFDAIKVRQLRESAGVLRLEIDSLSRKLTAIKQPIDALENQISDIVMSEARKKFSDLFAEYDKVQVVLSRLEREEKSAASECRAAWTAYDSFVQRDVAAGEVSAYQEKVRELQEAAYKARDAYALAQQRASDQRVKAGQSGRNLNAKISELKRSLQNE